MIFIHAWMYTRGVYRYQPDIVHLATGSRLATLGAVKSASINILAIPAHWSHSFNRVPRLLSLSLASIHSFQTES